MTLEIWIPICLSAFVFGMGLLGIIIRRNILIVLMCIELMLNAVNLLFVTFSKLHQNLHGQLSVFFIITVAAAESAVGLSLLIAMFRTARAVQIDKIQNLRDTI
jgi:NADH-quinone oxidoreductase subunit K